MCVCVRVCERVETRHACHLGRLQKVVGACSFYCPTLSSKVNMLSDMLRCKMLTGGLGWSETCDRRWCGGKYMFLSIRNIVIRPRLQVNVATDVTSPLITAVQAAWPQCL